MLGRPLSMLIPQVIGVRLSGQRPEGATATDLVLTIAELLRSVGVIARSWSSSARASRRCRWPAGPRSGT